MARVPGLGRHDLPRAAAGVVDPQPDTNLQQVLGTFIPVSTIGNPDLDPEKATVYSVGAIVSVGGFRGTIDYWNYNFKKVLTSEPLTPVVNAVFPNGASGANNCSNPALAGFIATHFVFSGPCGPGVVAVLLQAINGPHVKTSGVDVDLTYTWPEVFGGVLTATALFTYVDKYNVGALQIGTVTIPSFKAVGKFNSGQIAYPIPQWKGTFALNYEHGPFNVRYQLRYIDSYIDQRTGLFTFNPIYVTPTNPTGIVIARAEDQRPGAAGCDRAVGRAVRHAGQLLDHQHLRRGSAVCADRHQLRCADRRPAGPDVQDRPHEDVLTGRDGDEAVPAAVTPALLLPRLAPLRGSPEGGGLPRGSG